MTGQTEMMLMVIERAMRGSDQLTPADRADVFEGIYTLLAPHQGLEEQMQPAASAARALREAEAKQLTFSALLKQANAIKR